MNLHPDWLIPQWPAPARVRAVFTTRAGGFSQPPWDSLNLGDHVGDNETLVQLNRDELKRHMGVHPVFLNQVHGCGVVSLDQSSRSGQVADAALTCASAVACTIMVADCLPILLADKAGRCVAALHAGWRGLAQGVIQSTVSAMRDHGVQDLMAWLGPCIGPQAFEVGSEVRQAFLSTHWARPGLGEACFVCLTTSSQAPEKYLADLPRLARLALCDCGISEVHGNDGANQWCTVADRSRFFSHRRDAAIRGGDIRSTGRMAAAIWLD